MSVNLTQEKINILEDFRKRLGKARIKDTPANGSLIKSWCERHANGVINGQTMYDAANALYRDIEWEPGFLPAKLVMEQNETKVQKVVPARVTDELRAAQEKVAEVLAAQKKEDEKFEKQTTSLIDSYQEVNKAGRVAFGAQEAHKKRLTDWVNANKGKVSAENIFKAVQNEVNRLYAASERERERS